MSKDEGGIGMRDLRSFNTALLAKQVWRLATNPDSFLGKFLKGKYFPRTSVWEAKSGPNSSFTWRSILSARDLVVDGSRWLVGEGKEVRFWKDSWVPNLPGGCIYSVPTTEEVAKSRVSEWRMESGEWDVTKMNVHLTVEEIEAIKKVPLMRNAQCDILAWNHTKNGEFLVRSTYHRAIQRRFGGVGSSTGADQWLWRKVWRANVPPKVKNLVWRVVRDGLPRKVKLASRGLQIDSRCPRCGEGYETSTHMFLLCREARFLWQLSPLRIDPYEWDHSFRDWCEQTAKACSVERAWEMTMMLLWQIWNERNSWVFDKKRNDPRIACDRALRYLGEHEAATVRNECSNVCASAGCSTWQPPDEGWWKLNIDAAVQSDRVGVGMVVRDNTGDMVMGAGCKLELNCAAKLAEARAALFGLQYAFDAGYRKVVLESDCSSLIDLLKGKASEASITQMIVRDTLSLVTNFDACTFMFAKRSCNRLAHAIAKVSTAFEEVLIWLDECPPEFVHFVIEDKVSIE